MLNLKKHIGIAIFYFFLVSLMGILLRFYVVTSLPFTYKYLLHAHSHTAILGWIYLGLVTLIYKIFLKEANKSVLYKRIFYFSNICIIGMIITFPIQGYALFSIIFSTLFLFASYWFAWFAMTYVPERFKGRFSWKLIRTALWYLVLSSIGPWAIGAVMSTLGPTSVWYKTSIYIYLHFQYNAWFIFSLLGLLFYFFEERRIYFDPKKLQSVFLLLNFGVIATLLLSILWFVPPKIFFVLGAIGAVVQILGFYDLYHMVRPHFVTIRQEFGKYPLLFLKIAAYLLVAKIGMQLISAHPYMANLAYVLKDFVIGYLHMVFLGIIIPVLLAFLQFYGLIKLSRPFVLIFLTAFVTTELLIFYKATAFWIGLPFFAHYYICLAVLSCLFPIALAVLFFNNVKRKSASPELLP